MKPLVLILLIGIGSVATFGTVYAAQIFNETVVIDEGAGDTTLKVKSTTGIPKVRFSSGVGVSTWDVRIIPNTNQFQFYDFDSKTAVVVMKNGNMGVGGQGNPSESLDVAGNIRLSGNITSPGDICIGNCP